MRDAPDGRATVAHYLFNFLARDEAPCEKAAAFLQAGMWGVEPGEPHHDALAPGDLVLVYVGAPERKFIGRAELGSEAHDWTPSEAESYAGDSPSGVLLAQVEEWSPPVPMSTVLSEIDSSTAKADFDVGVVRISANEYETALAVARSNRCDGA